jgi:prepilin-type N-terminal cleavage/methylation domain-containing protein
MSHFVSRRSAFTLVELLVVIAIIATLIGLMLPAVQSVRESSRATACRNHVRQVGVALHHVHDHKQRLPSGWQGVTQGHDPAVAADEVPGWGWAAQLLPQMEERAVQDSISFAQPIYDPGAPTVNSMAREKVVPGFLCASDGAGPTETGGLFNIGTDDGEEETIFNGVKYRQVDGGPFPALCRVAKSNYVGVYGTSEVDDSPASGDGAFFRNSRIRFRDFADGLSKTAIVGERASRLGGSMWAGVISGAKAQRVRNVGIADHTPNHPNGHFDDFSSGHPTGVHFLFGDGSVRRIDDTVDETVYRGLCTRAGNETVGLVE